VPPAREHPDQAETGTHLPHAAAAFAEVDDRQTHELVASRFKFHPLQQIVCAPLDLRPPRGLTLRPAHAQREPVAQPLKLRERQETGTRPPG
jgi:hypothetical protein